MRASSDAGVPSVADRYGVGQGVQRGAVHANQRRAALAHLAGGVLAVRIRVRDGDRALRYA